MCSVMTDTNQKKEDEILKRMLKTPPKPHKEKSPTPNKRRRVGSDKNPD